MSKEYISSATAMKALSQNLSNDDSYAHSWHCNIAMSFIDSFPNETPIPYEERHRIANEAASRFMKLAFDVEPNNDMLNK